MNQGTSTILMLVVLFAIMYFLMIRPENKRKKKAQEMRDSLKKGDVITTIGGIVGKVVQVNNETIVIETSDDRVRMELTKWAVSTVGVQTGEQPARIRTIKRRRKRKSPLWRRPPRRKSPQRSLWTRFLLPKRRRTDSFIKSPFPVICLFEARRGEGIFLWETERREKRRLPAWWFCRGCWCP